MKAMIGAPVRNRSRTLPRYCQAISLQDIEFKTMFIANDCNDDSVEILKSYGFNVVQHDLNDEATEQAERTHYKYNNIATVRNVLLDKFLESDYDYLMSIDTDVIISPGSVQQLIDRDKDVVSMLIPNGIEKEHFNVMKKVRNHVVSEDVYASLFVDELQDEMVRCDLTGAVYLIKRDVIESGARYADHTNGEDTPFCETAIRNGFQLWCDTTLRLVHMFYQDMI